MLEHLLCCQVAEKAMYSVECRSNPRWLDDSHGNVCASDTWSAISQYVCLVYGRKREAFVSPPLHMVAVLHICSPVQSMGALEFHPSSGGTDRSM